MGGYADGGDLNRRVRVEAETAVQEAIADRNVIEARIFGMGRGVEHAGSVVERPARVKGDAEA
jgi:hypothetical protein